MPEINMTSNVVMRKEDIVVFFYNFCKVMNTPVQRLGQILDHRINKIVDGTLFVAKFSSSQTMSSSMIQLGQSRNPIEDHKWNKQMAQYLSTVALKDDPNGEGFAGRTHLFLTDNMNAPAIDITLKIKFEKGGAKLTLFLKHEAI